MLPFLGSVIKQPSLKFITKVTFVGAGDGSAGKV